MISHLEYLMSLPQISREVYGYDEFVKPNDYCIWTQAGYNICVMAWVETDEHFRKRIKEKFDTQI